ncbi:IS30 family transposase [Alphaproteobacteria bacterium]|nr:IS30 family transposase [Alphaproteobacteria bacterium]
MAKKGYHHMTLEIRSQIQVLKSMGLSQRKIAEKIGISQSAVSREIARNSKGCEYAAKIADKKAIERRSSAVNVPKKLKGNLELKIRECIEKDWSPEQISGRLKLEQGRAVVSHETIYSYIRADRGNGGLLYQHLRHGGKKYRKYSSKQAGAKLIPNRVDISERPAIVNSKSTFGHWEGDTIISHGSRTALLTVVERKSTLLKTKKIGRKTKENVNAGLEEKLKPIKKQVLTMTFDNGGEFAGHKVIAKKLKAKTYFATPYHSWERGLNEHTNGLIRQYLPKNFDFKDVSDEKIQEIGASCKVART